VRDKVHRKSIFFLSRAHEFHEAKWMPQVDVYQRAGGWLIKCDLAGIRMEDITISSKGSVLSIAGIRRDPVADDGWEHYSMEIRYSKFERAIALPESLEGARIATHYHDGMLLIRVRLDEESQ